MRGLVDDRGSVTAETAIVLPVVVVLVALLGLVGSLVTAQSRAAEGARSAARAAAWGEADDAARARAIAVIGAPARVAITRQGNLVRVTVETPAELSLSAGLGFDLGHLELRGTATAYLEPSLIGGDRSSRAGLSDHRPAGAMAKGPP